MFSMPSPGELLHQANSAVILLVSDFVAILAANRATDRIEVFWAITKDRFRLF
jgi:hypothetical protein